MPRSNHEEQSEEAPNTHDVPQILVDPTDVPDVPVPGHSQQAPASQSEQQQPPPPPPTASTSARPGCVRIFTSREDDLPQTTTRRASRHRSATVGAPEAVGLDMLQPADGAAAASPSLPPLAHMRTPSAQSPDQLQPPLESPIHRLRADSAPPPSESLQPPENGETPAEAQESPAQPQSAARPKSRARAFTSAAAGRLSNLPSSFSFQGNRGPSSGAQGPDDRTQQGQQGGDEMNQRLVDFLDAVDPEISTVSTLNNIQNSLFIPNFGSWVNRGSLVRLSAPESRAANRYSQLLEEHQSLERKNKRSPEDPTPKQVAISGAEQELATALAEERGQSLPTRSHSPDGRSSIAAEQQQEDPEKEEAAAQAARDRANNLHNTFEDQRADQPGTRHRRLSLSSIRSEKPGTAQKPGLSHRPTVRGEFAVLPPDIDWDDWNEEEKRELDDYVRHLLHSKREIGKRKWRGFIKYCSRPLGLFVTIYSFLLFFWGLAWILFIIGWINVGGRQAYFIEICDQILVALFALVGLGMIPWRSLDTYHMIYIAKYHRRFLELRQQKGLPDLRDENDLPLERPPPRFAEEGRVVGHTPEEEHVMTAEEEATFLHHQRKFANSHTFYRPHETETHYAFPLDLMITAVCLLDFHSIFQLALASSTWSISYHNSYKKILTSIILSFSISVNISAGLVIMVGDRRTRKRDILEKKLIQAITQEAIERKGMERRVAQRHMEQEERKAAEGLRELKTQATSKEVEDSITPTTDGSPSYTPASSEPLAHDSRP